MVILPMFTVSISMSLFSVIDVEVMTRSGFTELALPYFSWGLSMAIFIPVILGLLLFGPLCVSWRHTTWQLCSQHNFAMRSRLGDERPSMFADMIVIVEDIVTVVEQRYDLYSWYVLLVDGRDVDAPAVTPVILVIPLLY